MFAISDNDRRAGSGPGKVSRDVPVLFHLLDVSPRPPQTPAASPPLRLEAEAEGKSGSPACSGDTSDSDRSATSEHRAQCTPPAPSMSPPVTLPAPSAPLAPVMTTPASTVTALAIAIPVVPAATAQQHPPVECQPATPAVVGDTDDSPSLGASATSASTITESVAVARPSPAESEAPTPRHRTRPPASEDWLASHGKFIALGFLLALGATIYLARTRRQHGPAEMAQTTSPAPLIDEPPTISVPSATPATASRVPTTPTPLAETSPANLVETASATSESKVELHPPAAPPLLTPAVADANGSTGTSSSSKDNLFDFPATSKTDERFAARSKLAAPTPPETSPAGPVLGAPAAQPAAPELSPAYPTTSTPMPAYPVTTNAPVAYPTTQAPPTPVAPPAAPPTASSPYSSFPPGTVAVTSGYGAAPPQAVPSQAALPQPGMAPAPAGVNYRSAYAPAMPGAAPPGAAPAATTWTPAAPGGTLPPQYPPTTNTATGPRYERTGSGNY